MCNVYPSHCRTNAHNGHWEPASKWCRLCFVDYHYIIKLEEEPLELWYILDKLGLWEDRTRFLLKTNQSIDPKSNSDGRNETTLFEQNLNLLSDSQRNWINKYYEDDYLLFGYEKLKLRGSGTDSKKDLTHTEFYDRLNSFR